MKKDEEKEIKDPEVLESQEKEDETEVLEFEFNDDGEEDLKKTLKKFRADLKACKKEKAEYLDGWQKERAEFANYKKQEEDRKVNFSEAVRERIIMRFLTVLDSFDMAFANQEAWKKIDENWRKGVEHIYSQMNSVFEEFNVKPVGQIGESFDLSIHQSIEMVKTDQKDQDHKVANVIQKGYMLGDRVIRPARVNIFEYTEPS